MPKPGGGALLPESELPIHVVEDTVRVQWWGPRDYRWLEFLAERVEALVDHPREWVERELRERPDRGEGSRAWRAAVRWACKRGEFVVASRLEPKALRRAVFERHFACDEPRDQTLAAIANQLSATPAELEGALYADLPPHRVFRWSSPTPTPDEMARELNMAVARSLLLRAESLTVWVDQHIESVLRMARWSQLLCTAVEDGRNGQGMRLDLSGPLSLFRRTTVYGRAMAMWLPLLTRTRSWRLEAVCQIEGRRLRWRADHRDPLASSEGLTRRFDSRVESKLFRDLGRRAPSLELRREAQMQRVAGRYMVPDFCVEHPEFGRVSVEIVGFWTPEYIERKRASLAKLPASEVWLLCVDESLGVAASELPCHQVLNYRKRIDVDAFLDQLAGLWQCTSAELQAGAPGSKN